MPGAMPGAVAMPGARLVGLGPERKFQIHQFFLLKFRYVACSLQVGMDCGKIITSKLLTHW